jgi:hypothetical protein
MSSDNVTDLLSRFAAPPSAEAAARLTPPPAPEKAEYRAAEPFLGNETARRLRVYYSNGKWELFPYGLLMNVLSDSEQFISLIFNSGVVELRGDNLRALFDGFQGESIKALLPFDAARFEEPETGAPVIDTIEFKDARSLTG